MVSFKEMDLSPEIIKAIDELGFEQPTPIQGKTIPAILNTNNDIISLAQTGTGKTAAFGLPLIQETDVKSDKVQTLVLCPTRELCMQITSDLTKYSKYVKNFRVVAVYGGANIMEQIRSLRDGCQIVVGTPGRILDLIHRKKLKISSIQWLVLDEADEMLNMGFKEDLDTILAETPKEKRTFLFSATMPKEIVAITKKYMFDPVEISVGKRNSGADNVKHEYYVVQAKDRYEVLKRIADMNPDIYGITFCRTRMETKEIADKLISDGYNADALHGDLSQAQRDHVMNRFRLKHLQILVATDVAARGLDVTDLTHIINYNPPDDLDVYIHRSGRTGRAGKSGISISILHSRETRKIFDLEKLIGKRFDRMKVPGGKEICERQLFNLVEKVEKIHVDESQIEQFLPVIYKKLDWLSREDLIKHFVSVEFNSFLSYYKNAPDLNVSSNEKERGSRRESSARFSRFHINIGSDHSINAPRMIGLINENTRNRDIKIGRIEILKKFSFFEVESTYEKDILNAFKNAEFEKTPVFVELSKQKSEPRKEFRGGKSGGFRDRDKGFGGRRRDSKERNDRGGERDGRGERKDRKKTSGKKRRYYN